MALVIFAIAWRKGYLQQLSDYVKETRDELKKCAWPTWAELKGSTIIVSISILALGLFTVAVDWIFVHVMFWISKA
ncbi:MAG TPA: preprotein translocase subunit SecE [Verrucomicrobiae bacterium]|nr:preprotein translocase subunit SecE [Verrucomicrobiae bacterium]